MKHRSIRLLFAVCGLQCLIILVVLCGPMISAAGGAVEYQAGGLNGYPPGTDKNAPQTGMWQDRKSTDYRSAPPAGSWQTPWREEQKNQDRSWQVLDQVYIDPPFWGKGPRRDRPNHSNDGN